MYILMYLVAAQHMMRETCALCKSQSSIARSQTQKEPDEYQTLSSFGSDRMWIRPNARAQDNP
jgi:hypothetical protein